MELPELLDDWKFDTIVEIVGKHEFEPGRFDYKLALLDRSYQDPDRDNLAVSIRKTACSMANTDGGFILFGIRDRAHPVATPEDRIVGIPSGGDLRKEFGQHLRDIQRELPAFDALPKPTPVPDKANHCIFVVKIPRSQLRPHMVVEKGIFYRHDEGGFAKPVDFYEVRDQMLYTEERLQRVTLLRLHIAQYRRLADTIQKQGATPFTIDKRFDTSAFMPLLAEICGFAPILKGNLKRLVELPTQLAAINLLLDEGREKGYGAGAPHRGMYVGGLAGEVDRECEQFERELGAMFGPLGE